METPHSVFNEVPEDAAQWNAAVSGSEVRGSENAEKEVSTTRPLGEIKVEGSNKAIENVELPKPNSEDPIL